MRVTPAEVLNKKNVFAVVGASRTPEKYGYKAFKALKDAGYDVYPVNPNANEILGDKCYPSLSALPQIPDVVNIVVPHEVTEGIVKECKLLGIKNVWMQPGAESEKAIKYCEANGINMLYGVCVIAESKR
jgi:hypothetical protein